MNYDVYKFSAKEYLLYGSIGVLLVAMVAYLFYRSILAFVLFLPAVYFFMKKKREALKLNRKKDLALQFKEAIMSVSASLNAGYSVENAFIEAGNDLRNLYTVGTPIVIEFKNMAGRLSANENVEEILNDLAQRSGVEDIRDFADVFVTAKKSGGDLVSIIRKTAYHIGDKIDVKRDIDTLMSAKKMEMRVMEVIPFGIIFYLEISSPGFMAPLYKNILGVIVMTVCLALYALSVYIADRIVSVEV